MADETKTAPAAAAPKSAVAQKVTDERGAKLERISEVLKDLTNAQLDSVYQYAQSQVGK
jgi:hypothetical protein